MGAAQGLGHEVRLVGLDEGLVDLGEEARQPGMGVDLVVEALVHGIQAGAAADLLVDAAAAEGQRAAAWGGRGGGHGHGGFL